MSQFVPTSLHGLNNADSSSLNSSLCVENDANVSVNPSLRRLALGVERSCWYFLANHSRCQQSTVTGKKPENYNIFASYSKVMKANYRNTISVNVKRINRSIKT